MGWLYSRAQSKSVCSLLQVMLRTDCNHKLKYNWFTLRSLCYQINTKSVGTKLEVEDSKERPSIVTYALRD